MISITFNEKLARAGIAEQIANFYSNLIIEEKGKDVKCTVRTFLGEPVTTRGFKPLNKSFIQSTYAVLDVDMSIEEFVSEFLDPHFILKEHAFYPNTFSVTLDIKVPYYSLENNSVEWR